MKKAIVIIFGILSLFCLVTLMSLGVAGPDTSSPIAESNYKMRCLVALIELCVFVACFIVAAKRAEATK